MKKFFQEIGEQYDYIWWWLLEQGILVSTIIVNAFALTMFSIAMVILHIFAKWWDKFR